MTARSRAYVFCVCVYIVERIQYKYMFDCGRALIPGGKNEPSHGSPHI